jgi:hypothetical protein
VLRKVNTIPTISTAVSGLPDSEDDKSIFLVGKLYVVYSVYMQSCVVAFNVDRQNPEAHEKISLRTCKVHRPNQGNKTVDQVHSHVEYIYSFVLKLNHVKKVNCVLLSQRKNRN